MIRRTGTTIGELYVDRDGSLLDRKPERWLVCFVPAIKRQWWHPFLFSWMKHCFMLRRTNHEWLLFEPWWSRVMLTTLSDLDAAPFLTWGALGEVLEVEEAIPGHSSQLRGWMTCSALIAHVLGRRYWTWTPKSLHKKLMREGNRLVSRHELRMLGAWRENL